MKKNDRSYIINLRNKLKDNLSPERYEHSLGVEFTATSLAMVYHADIEKAEIAGLLHDCAKHIHNEDKISHALYGPEVATEKYGITDSEILSAIKWHTTGKADMSILDKIIFVADFIEPGRIELKIMPEIREIAFKDITYATYLISKNTIDFLLSKGLDVNKLSYECLHYLEENGIHDK